MIIDTDTKFNKMYSGNITVTNAATFTLFGMVNGNITINPNCTCIIHGMVNGTVVNTGGTVNIYGTVSKVNDISGQTHIYDNAVIINK